MLNNVYGLASALHANADNHRIVSENLAHLNVPGYRRQISTFESILGKDKTNEFDERFNGIKEIVAHTDFTQGAVLPTGRSLDVAINGDAFFEVNTPNGPLYTRNGSFHVDPNGVLVTSNSFPVVGDGGEISIPGNVDLEQIYINRNGNVMAGEQEVGKIKLVSFADNSKLNRAGTTLFSAENAQVNAPDNVEVQQRALEKTNASAVKEMVHMILGLRHYEASQRALQSIASAVELNTNPNGD